MARAYRPRRLEAGNFVHFAQHARIARDFRYVLRKTCDWSGRWESNPRDQLGRLAHYNCAPPPFAGIPGGPRYKGQELKYLAFYQPPSFRGLEAGLFKP